MKIGDLRHLVTIERSVETQDPVSGDMVKAWEPFAQAYANIASLSVSEFMRAQELQSKVTGRITIRYLEGVTPTMRIVASERIYSILGVMPDSSSGRRWLTLAVSEGTNTG